MPLPSPAPEITALVTGASSGIGADVARELASRGYGVTLVARREDRLRTLADQLHSRHGVRTEVLACDLTDPEARADIPTDLEGRGLTVGILVNNAGFGTGGAFHKSPLDKEIQQVRILCEAPVALVGFFLPGMIERRSGGIMTVASTAGMSPLPYSVGYGAAKAHALSFTEALHAEVRKHGVSVCALCPGPVETEFWEVTKKHPVEQLPRVTWVSSPDVARAGVDGLESGKRVVVPGRVIHAVSVLNTVTPRALALPIIERMFRQDEAAEPKT